MVSHSELVPVSGLTWMITGMRCRVVGVSRIRVQAAYPCMAFHTGYRRFVPEVPFLKVAYTPARPTLGDVKDVY